VHTEQNRPTAERRAVSRLLVLAIAVVVGLLSVALHPTVAAAATAPGAPTIGTAVPGNASVQLSWTAPASNGGSTITGYVVVPYIGVTAQTARTFASTATTQLITGLTNGTTYRFKVRARNVVGLGPLSTFSLPVTPVTVPGAPAIAGAIAGDGAVSLSWTAPASTGGSPITGYAVVPYIGTKAQPARTFASTATTQLITGLTNGTTYRFRVRAVNAAGTGVASVPSAAVSPVASPGGPVLTIFNGGPLRFGTVGLAQPDVNVLGRVSPAGTITSLTYRVNGGSPVAMGIGPDTRRLANPGDFNVAVPSAALVAGANTITLRAVDIYGRITTQNVTVSLTTGRAWPIPYTTNWATATNLYDVTQPVDGRWQISGGTVRTTEVGYDRLLAFGDSSWGDFEATVPVTVFSVDPNGYTYTSGSPGIGFLAHWLGHDVVDGLQPRWGFVNRFGGIAWFRYRPTGNRLEIRNGTNALVAQNQTFSALTPGVTYLFKLRAEQGSATLGPRYSLKVWPASAVEPATWNLAARMPLGAVSNGSLLLVAHHVDVAFGNLSVTPLPVAAALADAPGVAAATAADVVATPIPEYDANGRPRDPSRR